MSIARVVCASPKSALSAGSIVYGTQRGGGGTVKRREEGNEKREAAEYVERRGRYPDTISLNLKKYQR